MKLEIKKVRAIRVGLLYSSQFEGHGTVDFQHWVVWLNTFAT
ncbi:MAG: hypothetical protein U1F81_19825 [Verrucomicrobiaceae bacterium]